MVFSTQPRCWISGVALLGLLGGHAVASDTSLRSPWAPVVVANAPTPSCAPPPRLPASINAVDYYSDAALSIVDPERKRAYDQATRPLHDAARAVEAMADEFRGNGDSATAACAAIWLESFARSDALTGPMTSNQAFYVQGWMLSAFAIAWLKVSVDAEIPAPRRLRIADWLARVAALNQHYYAGRSTKTDGRNNHRYWAGVAVMAAGIAANRRDLFDWAIDCFRLGVSQVAPDGTLPLEMERRSQALHYHLFAAAPLVTMAELASANAIDLYHENDDALIRLVRTAIAGVEDPSFFAARAGIAQEPVKLDAENIGWALPFERRFADPRLNDLLVRASSRSMLYIGGLPPP
jgi:poly(beta-D-mannuronate) lyase